MSASRGTVMRSVGDRLVKWEDRSTALDKALTQETTSIKKSTT